MAPDDISNYRDVESLAGRVSDAEWAARVDLAAVYRLVRRDGWNGSILNHCSMRVPDEPDKFLIKAHVVDWDEVKASNLVKVDMNAELDEGAGVNRPGFVLHSAIMRGRADVNCVVHIHPEPCIAVGATRDGLLPISQNALQFYGRLGYHEYEGITEDAGERDRIVEHLGDNIALLMRNHGATTVGPEARHAYNRMRNLIAACQIQLAVQATGAEPVMVPPEICEKAVKQFASHDAGRGRDDWSGYLREIDRIDPTYRD